MAELSVKRIANGRTMRSLLMAAVLLVASLAICWIYQRGIYSRLMGPAVATVDELTALPSLDNVSRSLVEINAPGASRLGFRDVTVHTRKGRETGRSYYYFFVVPGAAGKPHLLLRAGVDSLAFPAIGVLGEMTEETRARVAQVHPQLATGPGLAPIMLEIEDPAFSFDGILAIVAAAAPLLLLGLLIRALLRMMDFRRVPGVAALKRFGEPVDQVVAKIDAELKAGDPSTAIKGLLLTPSWLVHKHGSNVNLLPLDDLVWLYTSVTTKKIYGLIPYSWKHALHVADRNGKIYDIKANKKAVPEAATAVMQRVPWVLAGFSDEIQKALRTNRKLVIDAVDERRSQVLQQWAQPQQQPPPAA